MLTHPTEQRLIDLGLAGMAKALEEQRRVPDVAALSFEERLGLLVDREALSRNNETLAQSSLLITRMYLLECIMHGLVQSLFFQI